MTSTLSAALKSGKDLTQVKSLAQRLYRQMKSLELSLQNQLEQAEASQQSLQALVALDVLPGIPGHVCVALVNALVKRASAASGHEPSRVVVLAQIRSCSIEAPAPFLKQFLLQPQVVSASLQH